MSNEKRHVSSSDSNILGEWHHINSGCNMYGVMCRGEAPTLRGFEN